MSAGTEQRKLVAIMFTDMVGFSALAHDVLECAGWTALWFSATRGMFVASLSLANKSGGLPTHVTSQPGVSAPIAAQLT